MRSLGLGLADLAADGLQIGDPDVGLELLGLRLADGRAGAVPGPLALFQADRGLLELQLAGEHLPLVGPNLAPERFDLRHRLAEIGLAIVPLLARDVARGRQPGEPPEIIPRVHLPGDQSGELGPRCREQFFLLLMEAPPRLDLDARRPRVAIGFGQLGLRALQERLTLLADESHVDLGGPLLRPQLPEVGRSLIDGELPRHRVDLRDRIARLDDHVIVRIKGHDHAADLRGDRRDIADDVGVVGPDVGSRQIHQPMSPPAVTVSSAIETAIRRKRRGRRPSLATTSTSWRGLEGSG